MKTLLRDAKSILVKLMYINRNGDKFVKENRLNEEIAKISNIKYVSVTCLGKSNCLQFYKLFFINWIE